MANPSSSTEPVLIPAPACVAAPLLKSLLPLVAGIIAAQATASPFLFPAAILPALILIRPGRRLPCSPVQLLLAGGTFLIGFLLMRSDIQTPPAEWALQPPREARLTFQLTEKFNARKPGHVAGIARILKVDEPLTDLRGFMSAIYLNHEVLGTQTLLPGQVFKARAVITFLPFVKDPDDYQAYLQKRHIHLSAGQGVIDEPVRDPPPMERLRNRLYRKFQHILAGNPDAPGTAGSVLASMILGDRSLLSDERIELYRNTGAYHLFAVSGLHVGSVALSLFLLGRFLRMRKGHLLVPVLAVTWAYVWLTGSSPSAVRAGIMISCLGMARLLYRQGHLFPALVASAWLVLLVEPTQLFHLGFQLSYGVVASILLIGIPLSRELNRIMGLYATGQPPRGKAGRILMKARKRFIDLCAISLSASLASMPLIVEHFELFTPAGLLTGILLNPLATFSTMTGFQSLLLCPLIGDSAASLLSQLAWPAIAAMEWLLRTSLAVPGAVQIRSWPREGMGTALLVGTLLLAWTHQRRCMSRTSHPPALVLAAPVLLLAALAICTVEP